MDTLTFLLVRLHRDQVQRILECCVFNTNFNRYEGYDGSSWGSLGGASGNGGDSVFYENDTNVTSSYTITTGKNAMSARPITINNSATVTIPNGTTWTVV